MQLPIHTRAAALVAALSTTSYIVATIAEIGHPPPQPQGVVAFLLDRGTHEGAVASVTSAPREEVSAAAEMPQP